MPVAKREDTLASKLASSVVKFVLTAVLISAAVGMVFVTVRVVGVVQTAVVISAAVGIEFVTVRVVGVVQTAVVI